MCTYRYFPESVCGLCYHRTKRIRKGEAEEEPTVSTFTKVSAKCRTTKIGTTKIDDDVPVLYGVTCADERSVSTLGSTTTESIAGLIRLVTIGEEADSPEEKEACPVTTVAFSVDEDWSGDDDDDAARSSASSTSTNDHDIQQQQKKEVVRRSNGEEYDGF